MARLCLFGEYLALRKIADPLIGKYVAHDPATTEPWATLLTQNTPGAAPIGVPVFIAQGEADELVKPGATTQYVNGVCAAGEHVAYKQYPGANHGSIAGVAITDVLPFFAGALKGAPTSGC
jgi:acetyl esterase/lipase